MGNDIKQTQSLIQTSPLLRQESEYKKIGYNYNHNEQIYINLLTQQQLIGYRIPYSEVNQELLETYQLRKNNSNCLLPVQAIIIPQSSFSKSSQNSNCNINNHNQQQSQDKWYQCSNNNNNNFLCNKQTNNHYSQLLVLIDPIKLNLSQIQQRKINFLQALLILQTSAKGLNALTPIKGTIKPSEKMILIDHKNNIKIWINNNYADNNLQSNAKITNSYYKPSSSKTSDPNLQEINNMRQYKFQCVQRLLEIVQNKTLNGFPLEFYKQARKIQTYFQLQNFIGEFSQKHMINISPYIKSFEHVKGISVNINNNLINKNNNNNINNININSINNIKSSNINDKRAIELQERGVKKVDSIRYNNINDFNNNMYSNDNNNNFNSKTNNFSSLNNLLLNRNNSNSMLIHNVQNNQIRNKSIMGYIRNFNNNINQHNNNTVYFKNSNTYNQQSNKRTYSSSTNKNNYNFNHFQTNNNYPMRFNHQRQQDIPLNNNSINNINNNRKLQSLNRIDNFKLFYKWKPPTQQTKIQTIMKSVQKINKLQQQVQKRNSKQQQNVNQQQIKKQNSEQKKQIKQNKLKKQQQNLNNNNNNNNSNNSDNSYYDVVHLLFKQSQEQNILKQSQQLQPQNLNQQDQSQTNINFLQSYEKQIFKKGIIANYINNQITHQQLSKMSNNQFISKTQQFQKLNAFNILGILINHQLPYEEEQLCISPKKNQSINKQLKQKNNQLQQLSPEIQKMKKYSSSQLPQIKQIVYQIDGIKESSDTYMNQQQPQSLKNSYQSLKQYQIQKQKINTNKKQNNLKQFFFQKSNTQSKQSSKNNASIKQSQQDQFKDLRQQIKKHTSQKQSYQGQNNLISKTSHRQSQNIKQQLAKQNKHLRQKLQSKSNKSQQKLIKESFDKKIHYNIPYLDNQAIDISADSSILTSNKLFKLQSLKEPQQTNQYLIKDRQKENAKINAQQMVKKISMAESINQQQIFKKLKQSIKNKIYKDISSRQSQINSNQDDDKFQRIQNILKRSNHIIKDNNLKSKNNVQSLKNSKTVDTLIWKQIQEMNQFLDM